MRVLIAIDPGASGAIAVRDGEGRVYVDAMPDTLADIANELVDIRASATNHETLHAHIHCYIEDAGYHVAGNNASASCKFARHCGALDMALVCMQIPFESVRPQSWMKHFGTLPKDKKARKNRIKELMQRRYPNLKVTLTSSDALALLTWAIEKRTETGQG